MYKWAATILSSRCFPKSVPASSGRDSDALIGQSSPVLCPVLDLANHSPSARVLWIIDDDGYTLSTTDHRSRPGEQIFNNYGPKGNEERESSLSRDFLPTSLSVASSSGIWIHVGAKLCRCLRALATTSRLPRPEMGARCLFGPGANTASRRRELIFWKRSTQQGTTGT